MGHPWPLFRYFSSFQTNITIQQQLYLSSIRGRDMNPQSSDCESHTITTRPRLASYQNIKFCCKYFAFPNLRTRQAIVTRFGKIPPLWPIFKSLGQFFRVSQYSKSFKPNLANFSGNYGNIFLLANGQIFKRISSHLVTLRQVDVEGKKTSTVACEKNTFHKL